MSTATPTAKETLEAPAISLPTGPIVAALFAALFGLLALGATNIWANADANFKNAITLHAGIGPYSGKELISWLVWLGSWAVLQFTLRKRQLNLQRLFPIFLVGMLVAVLLVYPPIFELF